MSASGLPPAQGDAVCSVIDELLALDLLTLREHTQLAGDQIDPAAHAARLRESIQVSRVCAVRRSGGLVAYAMLSPLSGTAWFVRAFNTHPAYRTAPVIRELLQGFACVVRDEGIAELCSHVYKTNRLSMAFHRKLGFLVTKENAKGVEFVTTVADLMEHSPLARSMGSGLPQGVEGAGGEPPGLLSCSP
jgi:L-amino acid N-acyltransferase YncA